LGAAINEVKSEVRTLNDSGRVTGSVSKEIQNAVINDSNVRLRVKPNLTCDTWALLDKGLPVKIKDKSAKPMEIDGESWYWYRVVAENLPDGWVYGKYLDIESE
jgi:SH3-like domain-containing protein